jgi:hypothetical protein
LAASGKEPFDSEFCMRLLLRKNCHAVSDDNQARKIAK